MPVNFGWWEYPHASNVKGPSFMFEEKMSLHDNVIEFGKYTAKFTHINPNSTREVSYSTINSDIIEVSKDGQPLFTINRERYRTCCNPLFFEKCNATYIMANTGPGLISIYHVDTGAVMEVLKNVPEIMVAIYDDAISPGMSFHLFGWAWHPIEHYVEVDINDILL
jgi:hypothetical protein